MKLAAFLARLKQFHPRHQDEIETLEKILYAHRITDEVFEHSLKLHIQTKN